MFWREISCWAGVLGLAISMQAAELPPIEMPVCETPPMLDGKIDEPAWQAAGKIENLYLHNTNTPAPETTICLMRDNAWLYLAAHCRNPNMPHLAQQAFDHDGLVNKDDSLELFIKPTAGEDAVYYHFSLNFANVGREQRCDKQGLRDIAWNPPWRTATQQLPDGWTAEIAIPLYCLAADDLSGLTMNISRDFMQIDLDGMGAKQGETLVFHALRPDNQGGYHNFDNFRKVAGMEGFHMETPFVPQIATAVIKGMRQVDGQTVYDLNLLLKPATRKGGTARVRVLEDFGAGEIESLAQTVAVHGSTNLALVVPAGNLQDRAVKIVLSDPASGNFLASYPISDTSALSVLQKAFVGRSYYTDESNAEIRVELGAPAEMLARAVLEIEVGGRRVVELTGLQPALTPELPVKDLAMGDNPARVRLMLDGRTLAERQLNIVRLKPRPGYETKADFIKGVLLKDQQPIFPVGLFGHSLQYRLGRRNGAIKEDDEALFRYMAEDIGLNTIVRIKYAKDIAAFMKLAEKYGLLVVDWISPIPRSAEVTMPLAERLAFQRKKYDELEPGIIANTKALYDYRNLISHYNVDEINLRNPDERIAVAEWFRNTVNTLDPYRPLSLLYARNIPRGGNWTRWGDILGYDVYPYPHTPFFAGDPGAYTAYYVCELRERCRHDNKIMWLTLLSNQLDPRRNPIGMSKAQMLCQSYVAIIYGARGLLYFGLSCTVGPDAWDALRTMAAQVKALTPALVNGDVLQNIKYPPGALQPRERKFPPVNAAVFRYPDGDYLLLAVNIAPYAVDTKFQVAGMQNAVRLFDETDKKLDGGFFTDKIEGYGTRAYRLKLDGSAAAGDLSQPGWDDHGSPGHPAPVEVALEMAALPAERVPEVDLPGIIRRVMAGKNYQPNPCFERQFNTNVPDFYRPGTWSSTDPYWGQPGKSDWYVDDAVQWNGHPSLRMLRRPLEAGGYQSTTMIGVFYPPVSDKPMKLTFSFYARSENANARLTFQQGIYPEQPLPAINIRKIGADWQRYHCSFDLPPGKGGDMGARQYFLSPTEGAVIWISGLQIEKGAEPTEFQDDSTEPESRPTPTLP